MAVTLYDPSSESGLKKLDEYLLTRSYITGYQASKDDLTVYAALAEVPSDKYVNVSRWYNHIDALLRISGVSGDGSGVTVEGSALIVEDAIATPPAADTKATAAEDDDDDDVDLFGEETEEEKKAAEERAAAVKASAKKKESGKSSVLLDVKPWDDETDMKKLEEAVRSVSMEGLHWGASKLVAVGYGIKKLQIMLTIVDDLVSVDTLIEEHLTVEPINEYVQSCDIVAFNKIFAFRSVKLINPTLPPEPYSPISDLSRSERFYLHSVRSHHNVVLARCVVCDCFVKLKSEAAPTMNNQGRKFGGAPSWFGTSATTPQPHQANLMNMINQRNHPTHLLSQPHPQTQIGSSHFPSHLQLLVAQSQYAQAQFAKAQAQAQLQSQAAQSQTHPLFASLHNNANTNVANVGNVAPTPPPATGSGKRGPKRSRPTADRGKKIELPEKQVPEKVASLLPESPLYTKLLGFEAQLDANLAMKKFDIQEALRCPPHVMRTLRVYVFNTFSNHTQMIGFEKKNDEEASWSLKINGRILEDGNKDSEVAGTSQGSSLSYPKFSAFFKRIKIYLDENLYPDDNVIIWDNALSSIQNDGFEVKRKGDKEFTARIILEMSNVPEMFMLSPQLSRILGIDVETRPRIIAALLNYVKSRNLQIPNDPLSFMCDPSLQRVFGAEKMEFEDVVMKLAQHLSPPKPIKLEHQIKLSGNCNVETAACYDIQVYVPCPMEKGISAISAGLESQKQIEAYDKLISDSIKMVHEHRRRRAFFLSFSQSPEEFVNAFITSKSKDLKIVAGDSGHNAEKRSRSAFYNQPWVEDAVIRYLNRKAAGGDAPGGS